MIITKDSSVLFIGAHADDVELGAGATLAKCIRIGAEVFYLALTTTDNDKVRAEAYESMKILGIKTKNYRFLAEPDKQFPTFRQQILDQIDNARDVIAPNVVFCPAIYDLHQDHQVVAYETFRAFKTSARLILGYELAWNNRSFDPTLFIKIEGRDLLKKIKAVNCYKSQSNKKYTHEEFLQAQMRFRGGTIGVTWAEAFEIYRATWKYN